MYNSMEYEKMSQSTANAPKFLEVRTKLRVRPLQTHMTFKDTRRKESGEALQTSSAIQPINRTDLNGSAAELPGASEAPQVVLNKE